MRQPLGKFRLQTLATAALLALAPALSQAQGTISAENLLTGFISTMQSRCPILDREIAQATDPVIVDSLKGARQSLCVCVPRKATEILRGLSAKQRQEQLSQDQIKQRWLPRIFGRCAVQQLQAPYSPAECTARFSKTIHNSKKFCQCMSAKIAVLSDSDAFVIGLQSANYLPLAAAAAKKGQPRPEAPQPLKQFLADGTACRTR